MCRTPPTGPNSFVFANIFTEKCPYRRLALPQRVSAPQWEIMDPPLITELYSCHEQRHNSWADPSFDRGEMHLTLKAINSKHNINSGHITNT